MGNEETKKLLEKREFNDLEIQRLKDENRTLTTELCKIKGYCPACKNWHYPHCGYD